MSIVTESRTVSPKGISDITAHEQDFTIPESLKHTVSTEIETESLTVKKRYTKNIETAIELAAVVFFILTCGCYAVYALLSLSK